MFRAVPLPIIKSSLTVHLYTSYIKFTHILRKHHFTNSMEHSDMFQLSRAISGSTIDTFQQQGHQNESP